MGVWLHDLGNPENKLKINWWNWRPTIEIIRDFHLIDDLRLEMMGFNGNTIITVEEARVIGKRIQDEVLPKIPQGGRMMLDQSVVYAPDDGTFYREESENFKNYSASSEWLQKFSAFCLISQGFDVG